MATAAKPDEQIYDPAAIMGGLYGDGIIALKGAFSAALGRDDARRGDGFVRGGAGDSGGRAAARAGALVCRGPSRSGSSGFVDIATHPWFVAVCEAVLGPDYKIVEVGFDIPFPGAADQPWHRDFPAPEATLKGRRLNSLAFNLTCVDTIVEMGPFEIAPGTQWDDLSGCPKEMFPPKELWPRYIDRARSRRCRRWATSPSARRSPSIAAPPTVPNQARPVARRRRRCAGRDQRQSPRPPGDTWLDRACCRRASATISPIESRTRWSR